MHIPPDAKAMAKSLRQALAERRIEITHGDSLECVARQFGWRDWNTLAAQLDRPTLRLPKDWLATGSRPDDYDMGLDETEGCAVIRYRHAGSDLVPSERGSGFGNLMQSFRAHAYVGRRVELAAQLKARDVAGAATIWLRIDADNGRTLAFDNMETRQVEGALVGTVGWQRRSIVLDVPAEAHSIHFGAYLRGGGTVWIRRVRFGETDASAPVTSDFLPRRSEPANLDFAAIA